MKKFKERRYKWTAVCTLLIFVGGVALAVRYKTRPGLYKPVQAAIPVKKYTAKTYDTVLLAKLEQVLKSADMETPSFTCEGTVNLINNADTAEKMDHVPFIICKADNRVYYKMGSVESINGDGVYLEINSVSHRVFIEKQKKVSIMGPPDASRLKNAVLEEGYALKKSYEGTTETITMINEAHVYCKEYAFTFDTLTKKLKRMYTRLANPMQPMDEQKVKIIDIRFLKFDESAHPGNYTAVGDVLDKQQKLRSKYKDYQLTALK